MRLNFERTVRSRHGHGCSLRAAQVQRRASCAAALFFLSFGAHSQSVTIVPGKWEVTSTTVTPMSPTGLSNTAADCMAEESFDPAKQLGRQSDCKVLQSSLDEDTLRWTMSCNTQMGPATGRGTFTSRGDNASGQMVMSLEFNGQQVEFDTRWEGRRVGDCG